MAMSTSGEFFWGAATAAYQIEGAADVHGRSPSIWDTFAKTPGKTQNGDTGDVACDHYNKLEEDLDLLVELGLNAYRFSVSWSRILPTFDGPPNQEGIDFYNRLVNGLLRRGITPFLTMYHWDLPQYLHERGGWNSRKSVEWFAKYTDVLITSFGDRVKHWITINEPHCVAWFGYYRGWFAPGIADLQTSINVAHHLLLAHGTAARLIKQKIINSKVGFAPGLTPVYAASDSDADLRAAKFMDAYDIRWFLDPVYGRGYPSAALERFNLTPPIENGDMDLISTPTDFLGVNFYLRQVVKAEPNNDFFGVGGVDTPGAPITAMSWEITPSALTDLLRNLHTEYNIEEIFITENGSAWEDHCIDGRIDDVDRIQYLSQHLQAMDEGINSGVPVRGYFAWSLLDNFEWTHGYTKRFGLVYVDFESQRRIIKSSGRWYARHIALSRRNYSQ
jgi:beta-glucosidase